jgi:hypothetical protein
MNNPKKIKESLRQVGMSFAKSTFRKADKKILPVCSLSFL